MDPLTAISPVDGRYASKCDSLRHVFTEFGLIKGRVKVELEWLIHISSGTWDIPGVPTLSTSQKVCLRAIYEGFDIEKAREVKRIEAITNHDVKAVEYFLRQEVLKIPDISHLSELIHFCCTSEDISNLAYALTLSQYTKDVLIPRIDSLLTALCTLASATAAVPLLAMTHGQPATPTTFGKEVAIFAGRIKSQKAKLQGQSFLGKFNGASGNFNAHEIAYPQVPWESVSRDFVETVLGLTYQPLSTQIECHDYIAELGDTIARLNTIMIDMCRDMWLFVSRGVLK